MTDPPDEDDRPRGPYIEFDQDGSVSIWDPDPDFDPPQETRPDDREYSRE